MTSRRGGYRLPSGGLIDRTRTVAFSFNGRALEGHPGDTLTSALIASGVRIVGRSFKYHRPRGFYDAGSEDPNAMLAVRDAYGYHPAIRAGEVRLCEGLQAHSVRGWPSPGFDVAAGLQTMAGVLGAGFYYKTFMWPSWRLFEPAIRRTTGFGRLRDTDEQRAVHHRHAICDVLIVGGGPAGLAVARALAGSGLDIVLADDQPALGGSLRWEEVVADGVPGAEWTHSLAAELEADPRITLLESTTVTAAYEQNVFTAVRSRSDEHGVHAEDHWMIRASHVVLATGLIDRPLLFADNDRPGIMLALAVRRLIGEYGVATTDRLAVYANNDSGYLSAIAAKRAGMDVVAVVDTRPEADAIHAGSARDLGIECLFDSEIERTSGYRGLTSISVRHRRGGVRRIACGGLAVTGGWTPLVHLAAQRGVKPVYDSRRGMFLAADLPDNWRAVGGAAGELDLQTALAQGRDAACAIARAEGTAIRPATDEHVEARAFGAVAPQRMSWCGFPSRTWVDLQNDVKASDIQLAASEGYVSVEHLKRYTTLGMGTDQGRTSNVNGLAMLAHVTGREIGAAGTTTFRPPYTSVRMGTIAGRRRGDLFQPRRVLPAHSVHQSRAAVFEDVGWERPDWYRCNGADREAAVAVEMAAVREHVGVFDGSPLGKIEVTGPDAGAFLARFYVSNIATLKPGRVRYSVMLKDDGVIFDDGVVACLAPSHFLAGPTSANAEAVATWFERWRQIEWPSMRIAISPVTASWASIAIAGPRARGLLARLQPDFDISREAFPHMHIHEGRIADVPARVARVSFTGELQYEISVPARYGASLLEALLTAEGDLAPTIVGLEAWLRLRMEKGYIHVGTDTNSRTMPLDIGMAGIVARRQDDFIGKRSLRLAFATSREREQLVGLMALDGALQSGGRIMAPGHESAPCPTEGYVTSACFSPSVGQSIGLALTERGFERAGEVVSVYSEGRVVRCRIVAPAFYDSDNARLHT
jgi:sarcosine oxidase subunit alpha